MTDDDKKKTASDKASDILKRVEQLTSKASETVEEVSRVGIILGKIGSGMGWVNDNVVEPVLSRIPLATPIWRAVLSQYDWFCHPREPFYKALPRGGANMVGKGLNGLFNLFREEKKEFKGFGEDTLPLGEFSRTRAGIAVLVTSLAAVPVAARIPGVGDYVPEILDEAAVSVIYEPAYDVGRMALTSAFNYGHFNKEIIYLNAKNEVDPSRDVWSVSGCENRPDCTSEDAVSFRVKGSLANNVWSIATKRGPFLPDFVADPIPNVPSECTVTSYGFRNRVFSKWLNLYPTLLEAQCFPLQGKIQMQPAADKDLKPH